MRFGVALALVALGLGGCRATTYESNLAFDLTQQAYVTDRPAQAVVVSYVAPAPAPVMVGH